MQPLLGFVPDADPTTPGAITDCLNLIPYENGMKGAPTGVSVSDAPALPAACVGAVVASKLDDARRIIAGTATKLYELIGGAWSDKSTGSYTGGAETRWCFTQFGDATIAANYTDTIQRSNGSGVFAPIATAPKARIVFTVGAFVMALDTSDVTYGISPNRWWCCGSYDDTSWTPNVATLATTGLLVSAPGKLTAGGRLGDYAVAYKEKAVYLGQFVGAPAVWDWQLLPGEAGCVGQEAWCDIGGAHFIVGQDNFWLFDGSRPVPVGVGKVRNWFYANSDPSTRYKTRVAFDKQNQTVWIFFCRGTSQPNQALVYSLQTKQWGLVSQTSEAALYYVGAGVTIDTMPGTIDSSMVPFDSQYWMAGGRTLAIVNTSHQIQSLMGATLISSLTTGDAGDDDAVTLLSQIRIRFAANPISAAVQTFTKMNQGDAFAPGASGALLGGKFDVIQSGRWHRATFTFAGDVKITAMSAKLKAESSE